LNVPIQIQFIAVPPRFWSAWPKDRPLTLLAEDARGIERRIRKAVNLRRERTRYRLLCNQIESLAQELAASGEKILTGCWVGRAAEMYIDFVENLQQTANCFVGKSIYAPGDEVSQVQYLFAGLTEAALSHAGFNGEDAKAFATCAASKAGFYKRAGDSGAAVIEVVSMATLLPPQ